MNFRIALYQPEIPANTGNIGRLCVGSNTELHIIKPMRFLLTDKYLKRAGLDYWNLLKPVLHENYSDFSKNLSRERIFFLSTKGKIPYIDVKFARGDTFVFGPETSGIPDRILQANPTRVLKIPMSKNIRSINLANSVAIILYEALRQTGFQGMVKKKEVICCKVPM